MFLSVPFDFSSDAQNIVLILNTILIITGLIVIELVYSEKPKSERRHLRMYYPLAVILACMLGYAIYRQVGSS